MKEYKINTKITAYGLIYKVCKGECKDCSLHIHEENVCLNDNYEFGQCNGEYRKDNTDICFKIIGESNK